jgi:ferrous iron transport protein B
MAAPTTLMTATGDGSRPPESSPAQFSARRIALLGNPNTGKTTLFNRLSGLRHKTSNFPGTTQEARSGQVDSGAHEYTLIDLPGIYSIELDLSESAVCRDLLAGRTAIPGAPMAEPDAVLVVVDATNLARNLTLVGEVLRRRLPTVICLNMMDLAKRSGLRLSLASLSEKLGCEVLSICARSGEGVDAIGPALERATVPNRTPPGEIHALEQWAADTAAEAIAAAPACTEDETHTEPSEAELLRRRARTDRIDALLVHPVSGTVIFACVAAAIFWLIFSVAQFPMNGLEALFGVVGAWVSMVLPAGLVNDLVSKGVLGGVSGVLVFVPQIALLFFVISLLEDTGYLARAAFLMDRVLRPFGLPGHAFVPLLSSHACAIPGIISTRAIPDRRERLATIMVAPFMTCSARLPVYVLVTSVLFPTRPVLAALAFVGCYALGIAAGLFTALLFRRTILKGAGRPMALELPSYKRPSIRTALLASYDRSLVFLKKAGTNILAISIVLWWLSAFPRTGETPEAMDLRAQAAAMPAQDPAAIIVLAQADEVDAKAQARHSLIGRLGRFAEPAFGPLGYDWQLTIGVISSFAAREVFVSTMAVVVTGHESAEDAGVLERLSTARRDDGKTLVFNPATSWSLLVFFVLAMQCVSTLVITAKETGSWKWSLLQLGWMTGLAYALAMIVHAALA